MAAEVWDNVNIRCYDGSQSLLYATSYQAYTPLFNIPDARNVFLLRQKHYVLQYNPLNMHIVLLCSLRHVEPFYMG